MEASVAEESTRQPIWLKLIHLATSRKVRDEELLPVVESTKAVRKVIVTGNN